MVELEDIQGILIRRYNMPWARFLFLHIDDPVDGAHLIQELLPSITTAKVWEAKPASCLNIAFTHGGLAALGLDNESLQSFPGAFKEGMAKRAGLLNDVGANSPESWDGDLGKEPAHVVVILFAQDEESLQACTERVTALLAQLPGVRERHREDSSGSTAPTEHFGYRESISREPVAGIGRDGLFPPEALIQPGEFLLGYPDETGTVPPLPTPAKLVRNGSYLVYRKLYQDVAAFRKFLAEQSPDSVGREKVAAKLLGRWRSGAPLVLAPDQDDPALAQDSSRNDSFSYRAMDPDGFACPFKAHIRLANPRDETTEPKRHRLLRRGVRYGDELMGNEDDGVPRGLLGFFINADIERQFEFVMSQWLNNSDFGGIRNEIDPFSAVSHENRQFTIPKKPFRTVIKGLPTFTQVRGGEYFFMPGIKGLEILSSLNTSLSLLTQLDDLATLHANDPKSLAIEQLKFILGCLQTKPNPLAEELRDKRPILQLPGMTLVASYKDVVEVLKNDQVFSVNGYREKMDPLVGQFVLALGNGVDYEQDVSILRLAVDSSDMPRIQRIVQGAIEQALTVAVNTGGRFDLVSDYARMVPAQLLEEYFGVTGARREDLTRWCKTMFHHIFLNERRDSTVEQTAKQSNEEMSLHVDKLIALCHKTPPRNDTVLERLVRLQESPLTRLSDERIRQNLIGLAIGVIDTTLKAVAYTLDELFRHPTVFAKACEAVGRNDDRTLQAYIDEVLRLKPQNNILVRRSIRDYRLGVGTSHEMTVPANTLVLALIYSAYRDPQVFTNPDEIAIDRPEDLYMHFGAGLHQCLGRHIGRMMVREMTKRLLSLPNLRRQPDGKGELLQDGPFPISLGLAYDLFPPANIVVI